MTEYGDDVVHGHGDTRFDNVRSALADAITSGEEVGAAIAIDIDGDNVVDIWGGHADSAKTAEWTQDTIVNLWSSTKTVTSLAALMLVDRGLVELSAPVAKYWPEFAANGKQDIQFRHILSHTSGVSGWEPPFRTEDMYDWAKSNAALAAQAPWWAPGTASGYHAQRRGGEYRCLAASRTRSAERPRQCALAGAYPLGGCLGRQGKRCPAAAARARSS